MLKLLPPTFMQLTFIFFSLVHQLQLLLALTSVPLPYSFGWFLICISMRKILFVERLRNTLVFATQTIASLISEFLLGNIPVNGNSPKVSGYLSHFLYLLLIFAVSHVNVRHIHVFTYPKNDY